MYVVLHQGCLMVRPLGKSLVLLLMPFLMLLFASDLRLILWVSCQEDFQCLTDLPRFSPYRLSAPSVPFSSLTEKQCYYTLPYEDRAHNSEIPLQHPDLLEPNGSPSDLLCKSRRYL